MPRNLILIICSTIIIIFFINGVAYPLLSNLRTDELYFLQCSYAAIEFGSQIDNCYTPATFAKLLSLYISTFGLIGAVVTYKVSVAILSILVVIWLWLGIKSIKGRLEKLCTLYIISVFVYYLASTRGIEIRPEFFAIIALFIGASPLVGRVYLLKRKKYVLPAEFIVSQICLSFAALLSLRTVFPALILGIGLIAAFFRVNEIKLFSRQSVRTLLGSVFIGIITLMSFHLFYLDSLVQFERIIGYSNGHDNAGWKWKFLEIGLYRHIITDTPFFSHPIWQIQRIFFGIGSILVLVVITIVQRNWREVSERFCLGAALLAFWFMNYIDHKPYDYVVAIEGALTALILCACINAVSRNLKPAVFPLLLSLSLVMSIFAVQSYRSNQKHRDMSVVEFFHSMKKIKKLDFTKMATTNLVREFFDKNFLVQLSAREEFCRRYRSYTVLAPFSHHPICLPDAGSFSVQWGKGDINEVIENVTDHPRLIIIGYNLQSNPGLMFHRVNSILSIRNVKSPSIE
jgi:hypothetical protein